MAAALYDAVDLSLLRGDVVSQIAPLRYCMVGVLWTVRGLILLRPPFEALDLLLAALSGTTGL